MENLDKEIVNKITAFLKTKEFGASIQETANYINHNRMTVSKYLEIMRLHNLVNFKTIAQAKFWHVTDEVKKTKVLVVDDDSHIRELVKLSLNPNSYRFIEADNGILAVEAAKHQKPELVILDLMMPHMDGIEACTLMKKDQRTKDIPVIILTAKAEDLDKVKGLKCGANDYITKPFYPLELEARVEAVMRQQQQILEKSVCGLPTFNAFFDHLSTSKGHVAFLSIHAYDQFVEQYGMKEGKELLQIVGRLVKKETSDYGTPEDFCAHLTESEFAIVTYGDYKKIFHCIQSQFKIIVETMGISSIVSLAISMVDPLNMPEAVMEKDLEKMKKLSHLYQEKVTT